MSKKKQKPKSPHKALALEGNFVRNCKPKRKTQLSDEQRRIKAEAWRVLDWHRPMLKDM